MGEPGGQPQPRMRRIGRMKVQLEGLEKFHYDVQKIIDELIASPANRFEDVVTKDVQPNAYGLNFPEATAVQDAANRVSQRVQELAVRLKVHIEAMRLTIKMSTSKAAEADQDNRDALAKVLAEYQTLVAQQVNAPGAPPATKTPAAGVD